MQLDCPVNRDQIFYCFPGLKADPNFKVTSSVDSNYNCIAWASLRSDVWFEAAPGVPFICDGVSYDWPFGAINDPSIDGLIDLFVKQGYEQCDGWEQEKNFRKVALYWDGILNYTHAARQLRDGFWTSKLGTSFDIQHGNPFYIEGPLYGKVHSFMRKSNV